MLVGLIKVLLLFLFYLFIYYKRKKIKKNKEELNIDDYYEKDENGFYPWEVDNNEHEK